MTKQTPLSGQGSQHTEHSEQRSTKKPLVMADGQIATDGGHLLLVQYVDISGSKKERQRNTLVKGTESAYSLAHNDTIRISTPHRFRNVGEAMLKDHQEGGAQRREEKVRSNDFTRESEEQEQALRQLGISNVKLSSPTHSTSKHQANTLTYGGGSWIFCAAIQPTTKDEWEKLHRSLPSSYNDYTTIHQPSKFAQALGLMFMDQIGPKSIDGTLTHGSKDIDPLITLHDFQLVFHGPVFYTDDVYGFLNAYKHVDLAYVYPLFVKDRQYEEQREYRFIMVGNDDPTNQHIDLRVSGMMRDSLFPVGGRSEVRVKPGAMGRQNDKSFKVEPKKYSQRENKTKRTVETHTRTLTINEHVKQREVETREVVVSLTSESVISSELMPDVPIGEKRNVANFTERRNQELEIEGVIVETAKGETTKVGYVKDVEDSEGFFSIEDRHLAKSVFEAARQSGVDFSDNVELRDAVSQLFEKIVDPDGNKNVEVTSAAWHSLWALRNLHAHYGNIVDEINIVQDRFISISLIPSPKSKADGQLLVGPLGTYAYVLCKGEEVVWDYGGEDTRLVLFPNEEALDKFSEFGWEIHGENEENG